MRLRSVAFQILDDDTLDLSRPTRLGHRIKETEAALAGRVAGRVVDMGDPPVAKVEQGARQRGAGATVIGGDEVDAAALQAMADQDDREVDGLELGDRLRAELDTVQDQTAIDAAVAHDAGVVLTGVGAGVIEGE